MNANKAVVDLIMGTDDGQKQIESVSLVFENGDWFIDDIRDHKKELKEEIKACEDYVKNLPDDKWLQGHWVYEQGNYKGHFVIQGNTLSMYSTMNPDPLTYTYRVEGDELFAGEMTVKLDFANQRIDYGDGCWMHKVDY